MFFPEERAAGVWHESAGRQVNVAQTGDVAPDHRIVHNPLIHNCASWRLLLKEEWEDNEVKKEIKEKSSLSFEALFTKNL